MGKAQTGIETRTIRLRPPLRTHARVIWEADLEKPSSPSVNRFDPSDLWAESGNCQARLYNTHTRQGRTFNVKAYNDCHEPDPIGHPGVTGCFKCNIFVADVALRAGFRVLIHPVGTSHWNYAGTQQYFAKVHNAPTDRDRVPLQGRIEDTSITWGWKIEGLLSSIPAWDRQQRMNDLLKRRGVA